MYTEVREEGTTGHQVIANLHVYYYYIGLGTYSTARSNSIMSRVISNLQMIELNEAICPTSS